MIKKQSIVSLIIISLVFIIACKPIYEIPEEDLIVEEKECKSEGEVFSDSEIVCCPGLDRIKGPDESGVGQIFECIKIPKDEGCRSYFTSCTCSYKCTDQPGPLEDCARACAPFERDNANMPNCGYFEGICQDLNKLE